MRNFWIIPLSLLFGFMLSIIPLPEWGLALRVDWIGLLIIFWSMTLPRTFGIGSAWACGIILDILLGSPLGQNALGYVIIIFIISKMHQLFLSVPLFQQAFFIALLLIIKQLLSLWINGITGHLPGDLLLFFFPSLLVFIVWPWLFIIMRDICRNLRLA
jgi:rod shape-determining protein MreD